MLSRPKSLAFTLGIVAFLTSPLCAQTASQASNGDVSIEGTKMGDVVIISGNNSQPGAMNVRISDVLNTQHRDFFFRDVRGLSVMTDSGADFVFLSGSLIVTGDMHIDTGKGTTSVIRALSVLNLTVGGSLTIRLSGQNNSMQINGVEAGDSIYITSVEDSVNEIELHHCDVVNDVRLLSRNAMDQVNFRNVTAFGDISLDSSQGWYADELFIGRSFSGGDLTIKAGNGDDRVSLFGNIVDNETHIKTASGRDRVALSNGDYYDLSVLTGSDDDTVSITKVSANYNSVFTFRGDDTIEYYGSRIGSCYINGGRDSDEAVHSSSVFSQNPGVAEVELGNF